MSDKGDETNATNTGEKDIQTNTGENKNLKLLKARLMSVKGP